jgi:integrase
MPLRKRPDSPYWQLQLGRRSRVSTGTADLDEAKEFERVLKERLWRVERLGDRGAVSFFEVAERWLTSSAREKRRDREIIEWLTPRVGLKPVREIADADELEDLRRQGREAGWSESTIDRMMGTVSAVLKMCAGQRYIDHVPPIPMYRPAPAEPRALTVSEFNRLCSHLPMHLALAARVAVHTLLRMRAMLKLTWSRVDLRQGRAWVPAAHQKAGRTFGLALHPEAVRALRGLRTICGPASEYVFTWQGRPIDDCNTLAFQEAVKRAKVGPLRWHDLRHTGASWAVQAGVTLPELMVLGDWKDYRSVLRYAHLAPSSGAEAAAKVARWMAAGQIASARKHK